MQHARQERWSDVTEPAERRSDVTEPADPYVRLERASGREQAVWEALWTVDDPELPVSIVDLGLIYDVTIEGNTAEIDLTLTYSGCPGREMIVGDIKAAVGDLAGIRTVDVSIVHSPPWTVDRITDEGRDALTDYGLAVPAASTTGAACNQ